MSRKRNFPIKFKLTLLLAALVLLTTSLYMYIAFDLYKKDKTAYIYDSSLSSANSLSLRVNNFLDLQYKELISLSRTFDKNHLNTVKSLFTDSESMVEFIVFQRGGKKLFKIIAQNFKGQSRPAQKKIAGSDKTFFFVPARKKNPAFFQIVHRDKNRFYLSSFALDSLLKSFHDDSIYQNALVDSDGILLGHSDLDNNRLGESWIQHSFVQEVMTSGIFKGVLKSVISGENMLVAYAKIKKYGFYVFSSISEKKSFEVIQTLINKTMFTALFIVSLAILLSLFIAKFLTAPIDRLVAATNKIAKGQFDTSIEITSNDEIGTLSESFNHMSKEIQRFTGEMKEKMRMESELNVAKLVQSSFFPDEEIVLPNCYLSSFYQPASECGGDWWGYLHPSENKLIVMIGDATGHGVPAALATATANCCSNNLKELAKSDPSLYESSSRILSFFNKAVSQTGGNILLTFIVAIIDFEKKTIRYSNAGHNPALLCNYNKKPNKEDIISLNAVNGLRLGRDENAEYQEAEVEYQDNSYLILYTDGLIEGKKAKNKNWNSRMFYKTIVEHKNYRGSDLINTIITRAISGDLKFYNNVSLDDDVTLVTLHLSDKNSQEEQSEGKIVVDGGITISTRGRDNNIETISDGNLSHLICGFQPDIEWERELITSDTLSFTSFFSQDEIYTCSISSSEEVLGRIDQLSLEITDKLSHPSYMKMMKTMAHELVSNAIFNAPIDNSGVEKYREQERTVFVNLLTTEKVELSFAVNSRYAAVSVQDRFGTLSKKQLIESILRGVREQESQDKPGGAGLGLYIVYNYANKLIIERHKGKQLVFTALIYNDKRFKKYKELNTSFHFIDKGLV